MNSGFLTLNLRDFTKGLVVAVLVVILGALQQALETKGIDVASYDWAGIAHLAIGAVIAYLGKNLLTDSNGKVLGKI